MPSMKQAPGAVGGFLRAAGLGAVLLSSAAGCQRGHKIVPAAGTVLYHGKPLAGATVTFSPTAKADPGQRVMVAVGTTDDQGHFTLQTRLAGKDTRPGSAPGDYRVLISKFVPPEDMSEAEYKKLIEEQHEAKLQGQAVGPPQEKVESLPDYASAKESKLEATVPPEGKTDFLFELQ